MARTLVTGANGFTGNYVVRKLAEAGHEVHALARPDTLGAPANELASLTYVDLVDLAAVESVVDKVRPEWVVHLAAISFVAHNDIREIYNANVIGSRNLLQALSSVDRSPSAVLIASSANIYGNVQSGALTEDTIPQPVNDYAISKLAMEHVSHMFSSRVPIILVRPFNYTGVGQSTNFVIPKIVQHARSSTAKIKLGNIDIRRDFSDVRSVADVYLRLLGCPGAVGGVFNLCSGRTYSLREILSVVEEASNHKFDIELDPALVRRHEIGTLYGDGGRLSELIGPIEMPPLEATLKWMLEA